MIRLLVILRVIALDPDPVLTTSAILTQMELLESIVGFRVRFHHGQRASVRIVRNEMKLSCAACSIAILRK